MKKRMMALVLAMAMCLGLTVTVSAAETTAKDNVLAVMEYEGATFTLTGAKIANGEELTITASGMDADYTHWEVMVHPVKREGTQVMEYFSAVLEDGQSDYIIRDKAVEVAAQWREKGFRIQPNSSRTFVLKLPEQFAGWTVDLRISGKKEGSFSSDSAEHPIILQQGTQPETETPAEPVAVTFTDVPEGEWYAEYVLAAAGAQKMSGKGDGTFDPLGSLTVAQVLAMAVTVDAEAKAVTRPSDVEGAAWWQDEYDYCVANKIIAADAFTAADMVRPATRFEMVAILDAVAGPSVTRPINVVNDGYIPDVAEADEYGAIVYKWYRAGLTSGDSGTHAFRGGDSITRAEAAVIMCRITNMKPHAVIA